jgi:CDGSH-type Zn-finger protein
MVHSVVSSTACATCHAAGLTFVGTPAVKVLPSNHIPTGTIACDGCHSRTNFTTFVIPNSSGTAPPSMVHSLVTGVACSTCHEAGKSFVGTPPVKVRPALKASGQAHVAAGECSTCHFSTTSFKGATDLPANHIPLPAADNNNCTLCHATSNYTQYTMNHVNITTNCQQCHGTGKSFANMAPPVLKVPPTNHIPTGTIACEACHSATNFTNFVIPNSSGTSPPSMVHSAVASIACASCHGAGKTFVGTPAVKVLPSNHIPTGTIACDGCHSKTNFATFVIPNVSGTAPPSMVHSVVTSIACASCHGAGKTFVGTPAVKVLPSNHIPTGTIACDGCHSKTNFTTFVIPNSSGTAPPSMVHSLVSSIVCSTCHEKGKSFVGTPAVVVRPINKANGQAHVPGGECSTCHASTTSFKGAQDLPANHIPIPAADNNNCALCHTTGNYSQYVMNHVNITNNCALCHGAGKSFANMAPPELKVPPTTPRAHIPFGTIACEACHTPTVFTTFSGTIMKHAAVRAMTCMSCHEAGMNWLTNVGKKLWVRPGDHANKPARAAPNDCDNSGCHSTKDKHGFRRTAPVDPSIKTATRAGAVAGATTATLARPGGFNHRRAAGTTCVTCHDQASGIGKLTTHMATSNSCENCHSTVAWLPVTRVDHSQVKGACSSCHNSTVARGKPSNHVTSNDSCENCHTTNAWTPARFDHAGVSAGTCKTCHDGVHAAGLPVNHVPTAEQCDACHGVLMWKPAKVDHTQLKANCASCHNNSIATGLSSTHMSTSRDCSTCHSYADWTVIKFTHASAAYPGEHRVTLTCASCHTSNTDQIPYASAADAGSCGGCHAKTFKPTLHLKTADGATYTASELKNCAGACHTYTDANLSTVSKQQPGPYHRVSDGAFKH